MVKNNLSKEAAIKSSDGECSDFTRDPSFSGWCDDLAAVQSNHLHGNSADHIVDGFHFELPLSQQSGFLDGKDDHRRKFDLKEMQTTNGGIHSKETTSFGEEVTSFNIENENGLKENGSTRRVENFSTADANGYVPVGRHCNVVPEKVSSKNPISAADVLKTLFLILVWYTFSTFLTLYNKTLLGDHLGKFPAPLLMNTIHFAMQAILSQGITWFLSPRSRLNVSMSWREYFTRVVPTALATALDINLSNASLVFITVTFATMCKSTAPIFLILFAFAFRLESPSIKLLGIIIVISAGVLLTVAKETEFELWGFIFVMLAAVMSGFRWCMTQILLQKEDYGLKNPLTLMSYLTPVMAAVTAFLSLLLDPWDEFRNSTYFDSSWHITRSCFLLLLGGSLAFFMVLTEFILVSVTSAVTVTVAGVVKEAVTIVVAVYYFHDEFTWLKGIGLLTIMIGVGLFNWYKYLKLLHKEGGNCEVEDPNGGSLQKNVASKYVILEEMDDLD